MRLIEAPAIPWWLAEEFPYRRQMAIVDGTRIHYVDEGEGRPIVLMHGNPTWSFLWRKVIKKLSSLNARIVAPDLVGLGLSEKPEHPASHTLDFHVTMMSRLVEELDLSDITIVGQDWGGPIVAGVAARAPHRVRAAVFANTSILVPKPPIRTTFFHRLARIPIISDLLFRGLNFPVPVLDRVQGDRQSIGAYEKRAYAYPLANWRERAAPLGLARMVPNSLNHPSISVLKETDRWIRNFTGPTALVWGMRDPILGRAFYRHREAMPDAHTIETLAGHFLQEEVPEVLADAIISVYNSVIVA